MPTVITKIIETYTTERHADESFIDCAVRIGLDPFKVNVYGVKGDKS